MLTQDQCALFYTHFQAFKNLNPDIEFKLRQSAAYKRFSSKTQLLQSGASCEGILFVLSGVVRVFKLSEEGREITLYRIHSGETCILSTSCIMSDGSFPAMAEVEEDVCMITIPSALYKTIFLSSQAIQSFVFDTLSTRLGDVMLVVEEIAFKRMDLRIKSHLESLAERLGSKILKVTHEDIALELGTAREVVSRILKDFEKKNALKLSRGSIELLDLNYLTM